MDAFVAAQTLINDFEARLRLTVLSANEPFLFYTDSGEDHFTGKKAWSLKGFVKTLQEVDIESIEFHMSNGDFENWARASLKDTKLADSIKEAKTSAQKGEKLRKTIVTAAKKQYITNSIQVREATKLS